MVVPYKHILKIADYILTKGGVVWGPIFLILAMLSFWAVVIAIGLFITRPKKK